MCRGRASARLPSVDEPMTTIRMELRRDGDFPTGRATDGDGRARDFAGWLGLIAAIDELLGAEREQTGGD
jgi:hypothetical protein